MSKAIHPAAKAVAAKFGCEIVATPDGRFVLVQTESQYVSKDVFDKVAEATEELRRDGIDGITWEDPNAPVAPRSGVMGIRYHNRYSSNSDGPGCNDGIDRALRAATGMVPLAQAKVDSRSSSVVMDLEVLRGIVSDMGLWREAWSKLNPGMQRMNSANRIRGYLRNNPDAQVTIGEHTGRFGVQAHAKKIKKAAI